MTSLRTTRPSTRNPTSTNKRGELLADLEQKALGKALKKQAGKAALIQRCPIHKRRNVAAHLPDEYRESIDRKLANAIR